MEKLWKEKPKARKPVKKGTWLRNFRAWDLRLDRRQQQREIIPPTIDETVRTCCNCGTAYSGRVCPQCGQVGTWSRYTWRQAIMNFLDIWGLGNRPMFRTLRELFWRPGYMVRDYLNGHRQFYFPPFKLLAVVIVFLIFTNWIFNIEAESVLQRIAGSEELNNLSVGEPYISMVNAFKWLMELLSRNLLYEWLFIALFILACVWFAFRHISRYNIVETYIFLIFVLAQHLLCEIPATFLEVIMSYLKNHLVLHLGDAFSMPIHPLTGFVESLDGKISFFFFLLSMFLLFMDFRQFYGLKLRSTFKYMAKVFFVGFIILVLALLILRLIGGGSGIDGFVVSVYLIVVVAGFYTVSRCLRKNKDVIYKTVSWTCKLSVLFLLFMPIDIFDSQLNAFLTMCGILLYGMIVVGLSVLPIYLYKKYHKTWISLLAVPVLIGFYCLVGAVVWS